MLEAARDAKRRLRRDLRERVAALDADTASRAAAEAQARLAALPALEDAASLLVCRSFGGEIDTHALIERWLAEGRAVYVPRAVPGTRTLTIHRWPCAVETLRFGLEQPAASAPALSPDEIDGVLDAAVLVGLGFDERAYRLGYGAGYFDTFLAGRPFPAFALAYDVQIVEALPVEPHDVPLAGVVTERRLLAGLEPGG